MASAKAQADTLKEGLHALKAIVTELKVGITALHPKQEYLEGLVGELRKGTTATGGETTFASMVAGLEGTIKGWAKKTEKLDQDSRKSRTIIKHVGGLKQQGEVPKLLRDLGGDGRHASRLPTQRHARDAGLQ